MGEEPRPGLPVPELWSAGRLDRPRPRRPARGRRRDRLRQPVLPVPQHHRLKTLAPGWHFAMDPDGVLHVTTPSGIIRTTRPPGMRPPVPEPPETTGSPPTPDAAPHDELPPF